MSDDQAELVFVREQEALEDRVLAVTDRVRGLTAKQRTKLTAELRSALTDLADGAV
jgi:hypothetical protein